MGTLGRGSSDWRRILQGEPGVKSRCSDVRLLVALASPSGIFGLCLNRSDYELVVLIFAQLQFSNKGRTVICIAKQSLSGRDWTGLPGLREYGVCVCVYVYGCYLAGFCGTGDHGLPGESLSLGQL